jgi:hypothetical protein
MKTLLPLSLLALAGLAAPRLAAADENEDTLRYYLGRSDLVLTGEIVSEPIPMTLESGVVHYVFDFRPVEAAKGALPSEAAVKVSVVRLEQARDERPAYLRKDGRCILFLDRAPASETPPWRSADAWFGIQPANAAMTRALKRLGEPPRNAR